MNKVMSKTFLLSVLCAFSVTAFSGEKVDSSLEAKSGDFIDIEHMNGKAKIRGWDKELVQVKGELDDRAEGFVFKRTSSGIVIEVEMPRRMRNNSRHKGDDLEIFVPKDSPVHYTSINANVTVSDIHAGMSLETVNGKVKVENASGKLRIESVNGDIETTQLNGDIRIETVNANIIDKKSKAEEVHFDTVNGHVWSNIDTQEISVETVNGDVELELGEMKKMEVSTVNGGIESKFDLANNADVEVSTVGGKIVLEMPKDVSARFEIEAHAGGRIVNEITDDEVKKAKYGPNRWLEFSSNGGNSEVEVSTVSGKVVLKASN